MESIISNFSITQIENFLSFSSTYGVLLYCLGLIIAGFCVLRSLKNETLLFIYFCLTEIFICLFFSDENIHFNIFYLYSKILFLAYLAYLILRSTSFSSKKTALKLSGIILTLLLTSILTLDNIFIKSLGPLSSENLENHYSLDYQKRLVSNKTHYKIRLEIYNKKNNYVKVIRNTDQYSLKETIQLIENNDSFWNKTEKFLSVKDIE